MGAAGVPLIRCQAGNVADHLECKRLLIFTLAVWGLALCGLSPGDPQRPLWCWASPLPSRSASPVQARCGKRFSSLQRCEAFR